MLAVGRKHRAPEAIAAIHIPVHFLVDAEAQLQPSINHQVLHIFELERIFALYVYDAYRVVAPMCTAT